MNNSHNITDRAPHGALYTARRADPLAQPRSILPALTRWDHPVRLDVREASRAFGLSCGQR